MLRKSAPFILLLFLAVIVGSWKNPDRSHFLKNQQHWVDSVYASMSVKERIGQLFMVAAYSNKTEQHAKEIEALITDYHIGGLIFFQGGPSRQIHLLNRFQPKAKVPLLIGFDGEWGLGMRLDSTYHYPLQMTLGAIQNDKLIYKMGEQIAEQCQRVGIHVNFAPVVDVNVNPQNPVIGTRSFGESKEKVATKAIQYMKGIQDHHVMACAKHFPGHGDTDKDSHKALPVITHSKARLDEIELYPFKKLIADSLGSVMVAHIHIPTLDKRPNRATTLSKYVVTDMLKKELGFKGLVFTDALNMKGVSNYFEPGEVDLEAFLAGNDVLLFPENVPNAVSRIEQALQEHKITEKDFAERVKKILAAKYWTGAYKFKPISTKNLTEDIQNKKYDALIQKLYEEAATVVSNQNQLMPIQVLDTNTFACLTIGKDQAKTFKNTLNQYTSFQHFHWDGEDKVQAKSLSEKLKNYSVVVVGLTGMNNTASKQFGVSTTQTDFIAELEKQTSVITTVFGNPYGLKYLNKQKHIICLYQRNEYTYKVAPQVIFGAIAATGKLPVTASEKAKEGFGINTLKISRLGYSAPERSGINSQTLLKIDSIAQHAITNKATPGCQVLVAKNGKVVFNKAYGYHTYENNIPVTDTTLYDVASITKVAATTQALMMLYDRGVFDLDAPASYYLPELGRTNKEFIYLRELLTHQAGLFPYLDHWRKTLDDNKKLHQQFYCTTFDEEIYCNTLIPGTYSSKHLEDSLWKWTIESRLLKLDEKTGKYAYRYSDLGYYILKRMIEKETNLPMENFLDENLYFPMGMNYTLYNPLNRYARTQITPTEKDALFRDTLVWGTVHDQGAAMMNGVGGHAGLFSTANDLAKLGQMMLQNGEYGTQRFFSETTVKEFTKKQFSDSRRALAWDMIRTEGYGGTSDMASLQCYGHTGFTGTALWIDPEYELVYVFLSNRVHPDANNKKLSDLDVRTKIHDTIYQAIVNFKDYELVYN